MADKKLTPSEVELLEHYAKNPGPVMLSEKDGSQFLIYESGKGTTVALKYEGDTLWLPETTIAELFGVTRQNVNLHLKNIFQDEELDPNSVRKESLRTAADGKNYRTNIYNLDAIISVGYRVNSKQGTMFRRWATDKLVQFATKGFVIDKERLKNPDEADHIKQLKEEIADIRASNTNLYREVRRICSLCQDYDAANEDARQFFADMENKLLWACTSHTAPELIVDRADATQPDMGLTYFPNPKTPPTQRDVVVANNYLSETEAKLKNRVVTTLLDFFETHLEQGNLVTMEETRCRLIEFIKVSGLAVLDHLGKVKRTAANTHAKDELKKYKAQLAES